MAATYFARGLLSPRLPATLPPIGKVPPPPMSDPGFLAHTPSPRAGMWLIGRDGTPNQKGAIWGCGREGKFTNTFISVVHGAPPEPLRYADNGMGKETHREHGHKRESYKQALAMRERRRSYGCVQADVMAKELAEREERRVRIRAIRTRRRSRHHAASVVQSYFRKHCSAVQLTGETLSGRRERRRSAAELLVRQQTSVKRIEVAYCEWAKNGKVSWRRTQRFRVRAALRVQSWTRMQQKRVAYQLLLGRRKLVEHEEFFASMRTVLEVHAALHLQAHWRGLMDRRKVLAIRDGKTLVLRADKHALIFVIRLQAAWRGTKARKKVKKKRGGSKHKR